ncbi:hypothetical protein EUBC25_24580 [Claveliimonas bilis]|uniref:Reverse transcriptase (RNA-dependent DNA polymerase) n=1 Tax=Claveliimonas bilis TaxID=3028070 RepID=UPI001E2E8FBA|nr:Reverse transcriptase (RNA-dependent DNA polymerase) [Claveliimonas bilis]BCZ28371.1 hypothetical protein EUBC25_24580 [Claveliimonas bilis]
MKTYCKPADTDIENADQNMPAVKKCFDGKLKRKDFQRVLIRTGKITKQEIAQARLDHDKTKVNAAIRAVCERLTQRIRDRDLRLPPIRQFKRRDGLTNKMRDICQESPDQQIMEYMAVEALMPMFKAKLLKHQYGSIPTRGQVGGKRQIERLLRRKYPGKVDAVKCDAEKAYPSITVECSMKLLRRDIGKNKILQWFLGALMENYPGGHLCIGGYLPAWLFNYVMSYVLRYLLSLENTRRGVKTKMIQAVVCFADDFTMFGHFSQIRKAIRKASKWSRSTLGLKIKNAWQIYHLTTFEAEKEQKKRRVEGSRKRTCGVDMMGFVTYRTYTIIRGRIFRRIRRQILRAAEDLEKLGYIPWWRACKLSAYKGWLKHSDSEKFAKKYHVNEIFRKAAQSVSLHGRKEHIRNERALLIEACRG